MTAKKIYQMIMSKTGQRVAAPNDQESEQRRAEMELRLAEHRQILRRL